MAGAGVFDDRSRGLLRQVPISPMMWRTMSLAVTPGRQRAFDGDAEGLGLVLRECLGGEDVLDFAGADAEGEASAPKAPVAEVRGVGVAADDGHTGLGEAEFGADDVDDALIQTIGRRRTLRRSRRSSGGVRQIWREADLVDDVETKSAMEDVGTLWSTVATVRSGRRNLQVGEAQAFEGLPELVTSWTKVEIDVEERGLAFGLRRRGAGARLFRRGCGVARVFGQVVIICPACCLLVLCRAFSPILFRSLP